MKIFIEGKCLIGYGRLVVELFERLVDVFLDREGAFDGDGFHGLHIGISLLMQIVLFRFWNRVFEKEKKNTEKRFFHIFAYFRIFLRISWYYLSMILVPLGRS